ncbi:hypothetical protein chiPu_0026469, partial [Chiloscyllium punctatum]|nr:hypothetical protein [Chiloscyllium punctatum]
MRSRGLGRSVRLKDLFVHVIRESIPLLGCSVFLNLGDFVAAKRSLKKAFTLGSQQPAEQDTVRKHLKN